MTALAITLLAIPILFGLARLVMTSSDWRYLAVAIVSTLAANVVIRRRSESTGSAKRVVAAFVSAVLLAAIAALAVGARSGTSIAFVAIGFAVCSVTGASLLVSARRSSSTARSPTLTL